VKQKNTVNVLTQIFIAPLEANVMQNRLQGIGRSISPLKVKEKLDYGDDFSF